MKMIYFLFIIIDMVICLHMHMCKDILEAINACKYSYDKTFFDRKLLNYSKIYNNNNVLPYSLIYDKQKIYVAIRGTRDISNLLINLKLYQSSYKEENIKVHSGYLETFQKLKNNISLDINKILTKNHEQLIYTGHSLGGVIAILTYIDLQNKYKTRQKCMTFGIPKIGNNYFIDYCDNHNHIYNYINKYDYISLYPYIYNYNRIKNIIFIENNSNRSSFDLIYNHHIDSYYHNVQKMKG